jgi:multidrug resistance efflux pump
MSPIDAIVADRKVQEGQIIASGINNVGGGTTVMTLADLSRIFVLVAVDQSDIGKVEAGQTAQIVVDAYPDAFFPAKVVRVAPKGVNSQNVVTYEVKVEVLGPRRNLLKPEMLASVSITAVDKTGVLVVPVNAVERRRRDRVVTVVKPDAANAQAGTAEAKEGEERKGEERSIEVGATDGEQIEVLSGLSEGELVQLKGSATQSRWQRGGDVDKARQDRMKMRMMGGMMKK